MSFTLNARRLGILSAFSVVFFAVAYAITLVAGLASLQSRQQPIGEPFFSILELLIMATAPMMIMVMVSVHAWAPPAAKVYSLPALIFISLCAGVTSSVHFVILTVGDSAGAAASLSFKWPSVAYAPDIIAWDLFFGFAMLFAAVVFSGTGLQAAIRLLCFMSGGLALAGLSGVMFGDMRLRMIGVVGYSGVFPVAVLLLAILFRRSKPASDGPRPENLFSPRRVR